eukprot:scaffold56033_cov23-Prasinocladus_malaysianus.AAC.1
MSTCTKIPLPLIIELALVYHFSGHSKMVLVPSWYSYQLGMSTILGSSCSRETLPYRTVHSSALLRCYGYRRNSKVRPSTRTTLIRRRS